MKNKFYFILVLFFSALSSFSQNIKIVGKVIDSETKEGLPMCNVYVNNTTIGINTDIDGNFTLSPPNLLSFDLVFTYVGFVSQTKKINAASGETINIEVQLVPSQNQLSEIEVKSKRDKKWERTLKKFNKSFFGYSDFADKCEIINNWVLDFDEGKSDFKAKASQPLKIRNNALGYEMEFDLSEFLISDNLNKTAGTVKFTEMQPRDKANLEEWLANRSTAYKKSQNYFYRSVAEDKVKENGFMLFADKPGSTLNNFRSDNFNQELGKSVIELDPKSLISLGIKPGDIRIKLYSNFEVHNQNVSSDIKTYIDAPYAVSWMISKLGYIDINRNGLPYLPESILVSGDMDYMKVAGMLPLDYDPSTSANEAYFLKFEKEKLVETAFLHTDRTVFYPGDMLYTKAYLNYNQISFNDSVSTVLYIQLCGTNNKILVSKKLEITNGYAYGNIEIDEDLAPGQYQLRAYTNYMRNYDDKLFFQKNIFVLAKNERFESSEIEPNVTSNDKIKVNVNKLSTSDGKEKLSFQFTDGEGNPMPSNFSIAILNPDFAPEIPSGLQFENRFNVPNSTTLGKHKNAFEREKGLTVNGIFLDKNKKPIIGSFNMVLNNFQETHEGKTDVSGNFSFKNLVFYDYANIYFKTISKKDKDALFLIKQETNYPAVNFNPNTQNYKTIVNASPFFTPRIEILPSSKQDSAKSNNKIKTLYGRPDYIVYNKDFGKTAGPTAIINGLRAKVPSLEVIGSSMKIRGGAVSVTNSSEPLLLLNGVLYGSANSNVQSQLSNLNPDEIERIEVVARMSNMYGDIGRNGIISVFLKDQIQDEDSKVIGDFTKINIEGLAKPIVFEQAKIIMTSPENLPTIYWNPEILCDEKGKATVEYSKTDFSKPVKIEIFGVTQNNKAFRKIIMLD